MADALVLSLIAFADLLFLIHLRLRRRRRKRIERTLVSLADYVERENRLRPQPACRYGKQANSRRAAA
jgi:hypothetical protein